MGEGNGGGALNAEGGWPRMYMAGVSDGDPRSKALPGLSERGLTGRRRMQASVQWSQRRGIWE